MEPAYANLPSPAEAGFAKVGATEGTPVRDKPSWVASNPAKPWRSRVVEPWGIEPQTSTMPL